MKQVILHTADDSFERRYVGGEYAVTIHASQFMRHTARLVHDVNKHFSRCFILPKLVVDEMQTVEAALLDLACVVVYRVSPLSYALGRPFVHVPHYAMANLIAGRSVLTELMQADFRPDAVAREVGRLLDDSALRCAITAGLGEVRSRLGSPGASARAAEVVASYLR